jgi:hypothetical protein
MNECGCGQRLRGRGLGNLRIVGRQPHRRQSGRKPATECDAEDEADHDERGGAAELDSHHEAGRATGALPDTDRERPAARRAVENCLIDLTDRDAQTVASAHGLAF